MTSQEENNKQVEYESFVRESFEFYEKKTLGRREDPAGLAEPSYFSNDSLNVAKVGVGYAMYVYNKQVHDKGMVDKEDPQEKVRFFLNKAMDAQNTDELAKVIRDFKNYISKFRKE